MWQYVPNDKLPAAFAQIPVTHPRGVVLPSVSGTPPAQEAVIDNSIPETATVNRAATTLAIKYGGSPQVKPIERTTLEYVVNSPYLVIKVDAYTWYALKDAVWFVGNSINGPWEYPPGAAWWAAAFPLGMYSSATFAMARETGWSWFTGQSSVFFWIALVAWTLTALHAISRIGSRQSPAADTRGGPAT